MALRYSRYKNKDLRMQLCEALLENQKLSQKSKLEKYSFKEHRKKF